MAEPATWEEMEAVIDKIIAMPPDAPVQEMWAIAGLTAEEIAEYDRVSVKQIENGWMAVATDGKTGMGITFEDAVADWWRKEYRSENVCGG